MTSEMRAIIDKTNECLLGLEGLGYLQDIVTDDRAIEILISTVKDYHSNKHLLDGKEGLEL